MHRVFSRVNSFFTLSIFIITLLIFVAVFISHGVCLIKHAKFIHKQSGTIINVQDIGSSWAKNFSLFKVSFYNVSIQKINEDKAEKIVSEIVLALNFKSLYLNFKHSITQSGLNAYDNPVVYFNFKGISIEKIDDFISKHQPKNHYYYIKKRDQEIILSNLLVFLNKYQLNNFKVELHFDDLDLKRIFKKYDALKFIKNNAHIKKIIFYSAVNSKEYIGQIRIKYSLNDRDSTISGIVLRQTIKDNPVAEIIHGIKSRDYTNLVMKLYGYVDQYVTYGNEAPTVINSNDFADFLLSYNISYKDVFFEGAINSLTVQLPSLNNKKVPVKNFKTEGRYNSKLKNLRVKKFSFYLLDNNKPINFSGNLSISSNNHLDLILNSNNKFNGKDIFNYWPINQSQNAKNILFGIVKNTFIESGKLKIKTLLGKGISALDLELKISDTVLHQKIHENHYELKVDTGNIKIGLNGVKLTSDKISINNILYATNANLFIPFVKNNIPVSTTFNFNINTTAKILESFYKEIFKDKYESEVIDGKILLDVKSEISRKKTFNLKDISFKINAKIGNLVIKNNKKTYNINSNDLKLSLDNGHLNAKGDIAYNKIKIEKIHFISNILEKSDTRKQSVDFILPLDQKFFVEMFNKQGSLIDLQGHIIGNFSNFPKHNIVKLNLQNTDISIPVLGINKLKDNSGDLNFSLGKNMGPGELNITNIDLKIPNMIVSGEIVLDIVNYNLKNTDLSFKKFFNNIFDFQYSSPDSSKNKHIYKINGSIIDALNVKQIINNIQKNTKQENKKEIISEFDIASKIIRWGSKDILSNLNINFNIQNNEIKKIDGSAYTNGKNGYARIFFDEPIFAFIVHNTGAFSYDLFSLKSLRKGNLSVYANLNNSAIKGDLYLNNFKVLQSPLLTTILRIFALSGINILQILTNGIDFSNMHCDILLTQELLSLKKCQAFSDILLLSADADINIMHNSGRVEGMIVPSSFINLPMMLLQRILGNKNTSLLDSLEGRQNFSINWKDSGAPVVKTNPISFVLPSIFSYFFSQKKTIDNNDVKDLS